MAYDKIVDSAALDGALTDIADAIRGKTGSTELLTIDQMAAAISGIQTGSGGEPDHSMEDGLVAKTIKEYRNPRVTSIGGYLFYQNSTIQKVTFDAALTISGDAAFRECTALTTVIFPELTTSGKDMFYKCTKLSNVEMPNLKTMRDYTFQNCSALKFLDFNYLETIGAQALQNSGVETLIIRTNKVCSLGSNAAPTAHMTVYVPQTLIAQYQQATNWSALHADGKCDFAAIEGSEYE